MFFCYLLFNIQLSFSHLDTCRTIQTTTYMFKMRNYLVDMWQIIIYISNFLLSFSKMLKLLNTARAGLALVINNVIVRPNQVVKLTELLSFG